MPQIDVKGSLFWLAVVLTLLLLIARGCASRLDRFRQHREDRQEQRQERREDNERQRFFRRNSQAEKPGGVV